MGNDQKPLSNVQPQVVVAFAIIICAGLVFMPQLAAVLAAAMIAGVETPRLSVGSLAKLWVTSSPGSVTGVDGYDLTHWGVAVLTLVALVALVTFISRAIRKRVADPQLKRGLASPSEVAKEIGEKQLVKEWGPRLRPSLKDPEPSDVGYYAGAFLGVPVWIKAEDPMILVGGSGSGKGVYFVLPWLLNAPGCVITTSNKMDNVQLAAAQKKRQGREVRIFAPGVSGGEDLGHLLRWDAINGCVDEETLVRRVKAFIPSNSFGGTSNGGHWDTLGQQLAAHLFHAAACAGGTVDLVWEWVGNPTRAAEAVDAIRDHPAGLAEHANHLESVLMQPAEQRASSWGVLPTVLAFLESRSVRRWLLPDPDDGIDLVKFVLDAGTVFIVGDKNMSGSYIRVVDALLAELDYITKGLADASPGGRLDPPVTYLLDEAGNLEYQGLPELITAGRGRGRVGIAVFQSRSQLEQWGKDQADTMWDAAIAKILLPGGGDPKHLKEVSELIGDLWVRRESQTHSGFSPVSFQVGEEKRAIFEPSEIRTLQTGHAILFYKHLKPIVLKLKPIFGYPEHKQMMEDAKTAAVSIRDHSPFAEQLRQHAADASRRG